MIPRSTQIIVATILGSGIVFVDGTVVNLALPKIAKEFHAGFAGLQWIADSYLLSLSALLLVGGSLGDIFGRKRIYLLGLVGFGIASFLCFLAPSLPVLIAVRFLQGTFGALLVPGSLSILNASTAQEDRNSAISRWTAWGGVTTAIGPLLGAYLVDTQSWRSVFLINLPLVAIALWLTNRSVTESHDKEGRHLDLTGAALAFLGLGSLTFALIEGPARHWGASTVALAVLGTAFLFGFYRWERRAKDPMLDMRLFHSRAFAAANLATLGLYGALGGLMFTLLVYLQTVVGFSALASGSSMLPIVVIMLLFSGSAGRLAARRGPRLPMTIGPIVAALGILYLLPLGPGSRYAFGVLPGVVLVGAGLALSVAPLTITVMGAVEENQSGIASAVNNAVSRISGLIVIALLGVLNAIHPYHAAILLCAGCALSAGLISFSLIQPDGARTAG